MNTPPQILIVEDDAVLATDLQETLTQLGYTVVGLAATGKAAIASALAQKPDLLLMDIHLRGAMNGIQAVEQIHQQLDIPVVYLTAHADEAFLREAKITDAYAYAYLIKPVHDRELRAGLEMALYKHATEQRLQHLNQILRAVRDVNQLITHEHDAQNLVNEACQILLRAQGYRFVWIGQLAGTRLKPLAHAGDGQNLIAGIAAGATPEQGLKLPGTEAARTRRVVVCHDMLHDERYAPWREEIEQVHFSSTVAVPIFHEESLFGVLSVYSDQTNIFHAEEIDLLQELTGDIAFGLKAIDRDAESQHAAEAIRESETRYRELFNNASLAIFQSAFDGTVLAVNSEFAQMFGFASPAEVTAVISNAVEIFADPKRRDEIIRLKAENPALNDFESVYRRKDGSTFIGKLNVRQVVDPNNGQPCFEGFIEDITEQKRAEEQILQSEKKYRELFQVNKDGIAIFILNPDGSPSTFIEVNHAAPAMLGYTQEEMLHLTPMMLEPDTAREEIQRRQTELRSKGISDFETDLRHKNGLSVNTEFTAQVIQYEGKPAVMNIVRDVSERKHAEKAVHESEARFRQVLENSLDASYKRNLRTNTYDYLSPVFTQISGYTPEEFTTLPIETVLELIHPDDRARGGNVITESLSGAHGSSYRWEYRFKHKDGQYRWLQDQFTTIRDEQGEPAAWIGSVSDINERKQRENELQIIADLSMILRSASTRAKMLPIIVEQLVFLLHCDAVLTEMIDPLTNENVVEAAYGDWAALVGLHQSPMTGLNTFVIKTRKPYQSNDFDAISKDVIPETLSGKIHSIAGVPLIAQQQLLGILWMGRKTDITESEVRLLASVADMTANALNRATLHEQTQKDAADLALAYDTTLEGWARALELRDQETEGHTRRVANMTLDLAAVMGIAKDEVENIRRGSLLHDIGKMGIPDSVLLKPGSLDEREWEIMRQHPEHARRLMEPIEYLLPAIVIPYCHHEKWDGTGYPQHLKGEEIPLEARIFAIVDVWDALTSDRPYRLAWTKEKALQHIVEQNNTHFDPQVVEAFLKII